MEKVREAARGGVAAFTAFWNTDEAKSQRPILRTVLADCQAIARDADEAAISDDSDPFGLPPIKPSEDDIARALAEAEADAAAAATREQAEA